MIEYEWGTWGLCFMFQLRGSIIPKVALVAAMPSVLAVVLRAVAEHYEYKGDEFQYLASLLSGYTVVLGFLLIFRTQIAYSRFWEGGSVLQEMRGVWLNATSSLFAFCNKDP